MMVEIDGRQDKEALLQLQDEHRVYSQKLERLSQTPYPSADDQMEELRLKKLKLRVKDEMMGFRPVIRFS